MSGHIRGGPMRMLVDRTSLAALNLAVDVRGGHDIALWSLASGFNRLVGTVPTWCRRSTGRVAVATEDGGD